MTMVALLVSGEQTKLLSFRRVASLPLESLTLTSQIPTILIREKGCVDFGYQVRMRILRAHSMQVWLFLMNNRGSILSQNNVFRTMSYICNQRAARSFVTWNIPV